MADDVERFTMNAETDGERAWPVADPHPAGEWVRASDAQADCIAAVNAAETKMRERCASICEDIEVYHWDKWKDRADILEQGRSDGAGDCAAAIRAVPLSAEAAQ